MAIKATRRSLPACPNLKPLPIETSTYRHILPRRRQRRLHARLVMDAPVTVVARLTDSGAHRVTRLKAATELPRRVTRWLRCRLRCPGAVAAAQVGGRTDARGLTRVWILLPITTTLGIPHTRAHHRHFATWLGALRVGRRRRRRSARAGQVEAVESPLLNLHSSVHEHPRALVHVLHEQRRALRGAGGRWRAVTSNRRAARCVDRGREAAKFFKRGAYAW
eukprot:COSAG05_NODE_646_length_8119_cov_236.689900_12_plen_221_part_00